MTKASGLLTPANRPFTVNRFPAPKTLSMFVEYYWSVEWSLPEGETYQSTNIPYPCAHVVLETNKSRLFGPVRGAFIKSLEGQGRVLGARIKSGFVVPFTGLNGSQLVDKHLCISEVFQGATKSIDTEITPETSGEALIELMNPLLFDQLNFVDDQRVGKAQKVHDLCHWIEHSESCDRVETLREYSGLPQRALERLFKDYIGLSPKWVIRLYRLQQLSDKMMQGAPINWAELALELGYFDQAHCIRDFKSFTGKTPGSFTHA